MKQVFVLFSGCILLLASETTFAQVAADYYLPLRVGNYLEYYTPDHPLGWAARTSRCTIEGSDSISGQLYFREKVVEITDNNPSNINVVHVFWLRKDSVGEILIGATGATDSSWSSNLDSATVYNPPGPYFSNQFIVPGYSNKSSLENYTWEDTTMSNTETVQVPAGTFTNCIKSREIKRYTDSGNVIYLEYSYYAHGIGLVMSVREIPANQVHTASLVQYNAVTSVEVKNEFTVPTGFSLCQNYPNPFNPSTTINYSVPLTSFVTIKVYDVLGKEVANIVKENKPAGNYSVEFNANKLVSGIYFYQLQAGNFTVTKKLILLK